MVSKVKLYAQLDRLEDELRDRLIPHLENAVSGRNDLVFCATGFSSSSREKSVSDKETDELVLLGRQILTLREKLGEPSGGSTAERICWYCRRWSADDSGRGQSAQGLAQEFLQEVTNAKN